MKTTKGILREQTQSLSRGWPQTKYIYKGLTSHFYFKISNYIELYWLHQEKSCCFNKNSKKLDARMAMLEVKTDSTDETYFQRKGTKALIGTIKHFIEREMTPDRAEQSS